MFTLVETGGGTFRTNLLAEARSFLHSQRPGAEVTIQGLGRVVFRSREGDKGLTLFYPVGGREPQDLLLEDILEMLPAMLDSCPECPSDCGTCDPGGHCPDHCGQVPDPLPEDPSALVYQVEEYRCRRFWRRVGGGRTRREPYVTAGGVAYWAQAYPVGTRLTLTTQVAIQKP